MFPYAIHCGDARRPNRWRAALKPADHGCEFHWQGETVHSTPEAAIEEAERHLGAQANTGVPQGEQQAAT